MKSLKICLSLMLCLSFIPFVIQAAGPAIFVNVNGERVSFDVQPYIDENDRTLVPVRFIAEQLGAKVSWDDPTDTVTIEHQEKVIKLVIGRTQATVNEQTVTFDTASVIRNGRTMVPVRFISETLGADVSWDASTRTVVIHTAEDKPPTEESEPEIHPVFQKENLYDLASITYFEPREGYLAFKGHHYETDQPFSNYKLKEDVNPDINRQVHDTVAALIDEGDFVDVSYQSDDPERVLLKYARNRAFAYNGSTFFQFIFFEDEGFNAYKDSLGKGENFSKNAVIFMKLNSLWWDDPQKAGEDRSVPRYKEKLDDAMIALFGDSTGEKVFDYIYGRYVDKARKGNEAYENVRETKIIDDIQIDFGNDRGSPLYFYFSYVEDGAQ